MTAGSASVKGVKRWRRKHVFPPDRPSYQHIYNVLLQPTRQKDGRISFFSLTMPLSIVSTNSKSLISMGNGLLLK